MGLDAMRIKVRPICKPKHKQPCYQVVPAYVNGVGESLFKVGRCLSDVGVCVKDDVRYIVVCIKAWKW